MKDYIFFDLDGTLTDSQPGIYESLRVMLEHFGIEKTDEELKPFLGPALWESLPKYCGFTHEQCVEAVAVFRKHYFSTGIYNNNLYPGVEELLKRLKENGKHLVLATGKPEPQANEVLRYFDLTKYFEFIGGSTLDVSRSKKAQVIAYAMKNCSLTQDDCERIIMVGDRENDINGAHENGIKVVAVLYGYGSQKEFEEHKADYIVPTIQELGDLLLEL